MKTILCNDLSAFLRLACILIIAPLLAHCEAGQPEQAVSIDNVHMLALPPERNTGAVYLSIRNHSREEQTITYVESPNAEAVEVHRNFYDNGMMRMRSVRHVTVPVGGVLHFEPGGYHLMVMGLDTDFAPGDRFGLTMEFANGEVHQLMVDVR